MHPHVSISVSRNASKMYLVTCYLVTETYFECMRQDPRPQTSDSFVSNKTVLNFLWVTLTSTHAEIPLLEIFSISHGRGRTTCTCRDGLLQNPNYEKQEWRFYG